MRKANEKSGRVVSHCQMCGANSLGVALERAFNPRAKVMTLCRDCRIGSAELLADERERMIIALQSVLSDTQGSSGENALVNRSTLDAVWNVVTPQKRKAVSRG